jgi:hypothetical protein
MFLLMPTETLVWSVKMDGSTERVFEVLDASPNASPSSRLDFLLVELRGLDMFLDLGRLLVGLILLWNAVQCLAWSLTWPILWHGGQVIHKIQLQSGQDMKMDR